MIKSLKKILMVFVLFAGVATSAHAQSAAIKTNLLYGATATPNLQLEFGLNKKSTLELGAGVNWFEFNNNKKFKHILVQPEYRYWFCETFNGHFLGVHAHGAQFNVGGWDIPVGRLDAFKENRYEGYLYGGGLSWGYQWVLSPRWNFEASIGGGFARIHYDKYDCATCGTKQDEGKYNYWGVTKAALSLIYVIN